MYIQDLESTDPVNLIVDTKLEEFEPAPPQTQGSVISWSPPQPNWNAWTACNIDEGPLANVSFFIRIIPTHCKQLHNFITRACWYILVLSL